MVSHADGRQRVGEIMADRTIYAGICQDTGKPIYTTPRDAPLPYAFNDAVEYPLGGTFPSRVL